MKIFIFEYIDQVTGNYHSGGGLMVIANNSAHVNELISNEEDIKITDEEWGKVIVYELKEDVEPKIIAFPDAGCC